MIHLIRKEYGYTDEYILGKSLDWLKFSVDSILEDRYNEKLQEAQIIQLHIAQLMTNEKIEIPQWKELKNNLEDNGEEDEPTEEELKEFGILK